MTDHSTLIVALSVAMRDAGDEYEGDLLRIARNLVMAAESRDDLARIVLTNAARELAAIAQGRNKNEQA